MTAADTSYEIDRPTNGDIVELILRDHTAMEGLAREVRRAGAHRADARTAFAELVIAHGESEEEIAYPKLRRKDAITEHEAEHGEEEHAELNEALLALLECRGTDTQKWDDAAEEVASALSHHLAEEELTILNPALEEIGEQARADLGVQWVTRRNQLLEEGCASEEQVRAIVKRAVKEGTLAPEEAREQAEAIKKDAKEQAEEIEEAAKEQAKGS